MVCLSISIFERATICHTTMLEPFVTVLGHELAAFAQFLGNPADHGFFITNLVMVDLHGHGWKSKSSFDISAATADQPQGCLLILYVPLISK